MTQSHWARRISPLRSFQRSLAITFVCAATLPAMILAVPLVHRISAIIHDNAVRELSLQAAKVADTLRSEFSATVDHSLNLSKEGDIQRGVQSLLFSDRVDLLLNDFLKRNPVASAIYLFNADKRMIDAAPYALSAEGLPLNVIERLKALPGLDEPASSVPYELVDSNDEAFLREHFRVLHRTLDPELRSAEVIFLIVPVIGLADRVTAALVVAIPSSNLARTGIAAVQPPARFELRTDNRPLWSTAPSQSERIEPRMIQADATIHLPTPAGQKEFPLTIRIAEPSAVRLAVVRDTVLRLSLGLLAIALVVGAAFYFLARIILRPLEAMTRYVRTLSLGHYETSRPEVAFDEFRAFVDTLDEMRRNILGHIETQREQERAKGELARAQMQSELNALRSQMNPHFLFNIMNSIATMVSIDHEQAIMMLNKLSLLYRAIVESSKTTTSPLRKELEIIANYLDLEQIRFGERLRYTIDIADQAADAQIPGLLLQTLVENCVKHGIAKDRNGGTIKLSVRAVPGGLIEFEIRNTGAALKKNPTFGTGLTNSVKRLDLLYPGTHQFDIGQAESGETRVRFFITGEKQ